MFGSSRFLRLVIGLIGSVGIGLFILWILNLNPKPLTKYDPANRFGPPIWLNGAHDPWMVRGRNNIVVLIGMDGASVVRLPDGRNLKDMEILGWSSSAVANEQWLAYVVEVTDQTQSYINVVNLVTGQETELQCKDAYRVGRRYDLKTGQIAKIGLKRENISYDDTVRDEAPGCRGLFLHSLDISGNLIVWREESLGREYDKIYAYDLMNHVRTLIADGPAASRNFPKVSENWVVYTEEDISSGQATLRAHSLKTGEDLGIGSVSRYSPDDMLDALDGNKVAWIDNGSHNVHLYDLETRNDCELTPPSSHYLGGMSISETSHVLIFREGDQWNMLDWSNSEIQPAPLSWPVIYDIIVVGDYLVWMSNSESFATKIWP